MKYADLKSLLRSRVEELELDYHYGTKTRFFQYKGTLPVVHFDPIRFQGSFSQTTELLASVSASFMDRRGSLKMKEEEVDLQIIDPMFEKAVSFLDDLQSNVSLRQSYGVFHVQEPFSLVTVPDFSWNDKLLAGVFLSFQLVIGNSYNIPT